MKKSILLAIAFAFIATAAVAQQAPQCNTPRDKVTVVGTTAVSCPAAQLANRTALMICNSAENASDPIVKVRLDGTAPILGSGAGTTLLKGQCIPFNVNSKVIPKCIADTAGVLVSTVECAAPY